jgi:hypothetical protein
VDNAHPGRFFLIFCLIFSVPMVHHHRLVCVHIGTGVKVDTMMMRFVGFLFSQPKRKRRRKDYFFSFSPPVVFFISHPRAVQSEMIHPSIRADK